MHICGKLDGFPYFAVNNGGYDESTNSDERRR